MIFLLTDRSFCAFLLRLQIFLMIIAVYSERRSSVFLPCVFFEPVFDP